MISGTGRPAFRRVLLALDPSADYEAAIEETIRLATRLGAELSALFVEDERLLGVSRHPFVRAYSPAGAAWQSFDAADIEDAFRGLADRMRDAVDRLASDRLRWTFRVVRGDIEAEALSAADEADLVVLGAGIDRLQAALRPPSLARNIPARKGERSVLLVRPQALQATRIVLAYNGSSGADRALQAAHLMAVPNDISVALIGPDAKSARVLEARVQERLGDDAVGIEFFTMPGASAAELCGLSARVGAGVLVMAADNPLVADEASARRLDETACRVLVVR